MLDSMERATNEPSALADLFRLDHLTTRMRRHAEGLIVLSGAAPGRGWAADPVPVLDVLRAATGLRPGERGQRLAGRGRGRGEARRSTWSLGWVENATSASWPTTGWNTAPDSIGKGFAVKSRTAGSGLAPRNLPRYATRASPPAEFDLANEAGSVPWSATRRPGTRIRLQIP